MYSMQKLCTACSWKTNIMIILGYASSTEYTQFEWHAIHSQVQSIAMNLTNWCNAIFSFHLSLSCLRQYLDSRPKYIEFFLFYSRKNRSFIVTISNLFIQFTRLKLVTVLPKITHYNSSRFVVTIVSVDWRAWRSKFVQKSIVSLCGFNAVVNPSLLMETYGIWSPSIDWNRSPKSCVGSLQ